MPSAVHPDHHSHDGHPVTHHHREHAINDQPAYVADDPAKHADFCDLVNHIDEHGNDVTDWAADHEYSPADHIDAACVVQAVNAYRNLIATLDDLDEARIELGKALAALSPEERAEFEARARQNG